MKEHYFVLNGILYDMEDYDGHDRFNDLTLEEREGAVEFFDYYEALEEVAKQNEN